MFLLQRSSFNFGTYQVAAIVYMLWRLCYDFYPILSNNYEFMMFKSVYLMIRIAMTALERRAGPTTSASMGSREQAHVRK